MDIVMKKGVRGKERPQDAGLNERRVVRVLPTSDAIRKYIKHQPSRVGFLKEGSAEWPFDQYTRNRIRDGDVIIEKPAALVGQKKLVDRTKEKKEKAPA